MKKIFKPLSLAFLLFILVGCNNTTSSSTSDDSVQKDSVEYIYNILVNDSIEKEVNDSSSVKFIETNEDSNRIETFKEDVEILNNQQTYYFGTYDVKYHQTPSFNSKDSYVRKSEVKEYDGVKVYYDVTDYENNNQKDKASRLPIVKDGNEEEDGINYLLEKSVPNQLCKQSSLFVAQFISTYLINNIDLGGVVPAVYFKNNDDNTTSYYLHDFAYDYTLEGIKTEITISFDITLETGTNTLLNAKTVYQTKEIQAEDDYFFTKDTLEYQVNYENRKDKVDNPINSEDYFLQEVNSIRAYVLDGSDKKYYELDSLPINKYVRFEALDYKPSKAVDIMMYPKLTSKSDVILDSETCFASKPISSLITFESATGIVFSIDVTFVETLVEDINFTCTDEIIEKEYDENSQLSAYLVYNNTTYESIYVSTSNGKIDQNDIVFEIEHEDLMSLTLTNATDKMLTYRLEVLDNPTNILNTTITFKSLSNPDVEEVVNFKLKQKLEHEDLIEFMQQHTYVYKNIYTNLVYKIVFTSDSEGIYYDNLGEGEIQIPFIYSVDDNYYLAISFSKDTYYQYDKNDLRITRDGKNLKLFVGDGSYATHTYVAE